MASSSDSFDNLDKCTIPITSTHNSKQNGNNSKKKQNYGSLRKDLPIQEQKQIVNIKHKLTNGETLQGISLKYGVSIENIKRVNKIWTNNIDDFVKDYLIIPIEKEKIDNVNLVIKNDEENTDAKTNSSNVQTNPTDYKDYLSKFDSFLNESKEKLKNLESNKTQVQSLRTDEVDFIFKNPKRESKSLYSNEEFLLATPELVIKQTNGSNSSNQQRAKHAYETLKKIEKEKDDFYEL